MTNQKRTWISGILALAATMLVIWLSPSPDYQARGIVLPAKTTRPEISPVIVRQHLRRPFSSTYLGTINIQRYYAPNDQRQAAVEILGLARELSAKVGANVFVVERNFIARVSGSNYTTVLQAKAYETNDSN